MSCGLFRHKQGTVTLSCGALLLGTLAGLALFAPLIAPANPIDVNLSQRLIPPFESSALLGTDQLGRCVLSRLLHGARITFTAVFAILSFTVLSGTLLGCLAGQGPAWVDGLLTRFTDGVMAFPGLILALAIAGILGPGLSSVILALCGVQWVRFFRLARSMTASLRERAYVQAAIISGAGTWAIMIGHVLPKLLPSVAVLATLQMGRIVLSVSSLSFLGLGAIPPAPEWGAMLSESKTYMQSAPYLFFLPGFCIFLAVLGGQLMGMGLQKKLDLSRKGYL